MNRSWSVSRGMVVLTVLPWLALADVKVDKTADGFAVATDVYAAKADTAGSLTSLVIAGSEFLAPPTDIVWNGARTTAPGVYACPMGQWYRPFKLPGNAELRGTDTIHAEGNQWQIDYKFLPDAIEITYSGTPDGQRGFRAGYPPAELTLSLAHDLARCTDPANQGEFGWPVTRKQEPGDFAFLDKNGAGFVAVGASWVTAVKNAANIPAAPNRLDLLVFNTYDQTPKPITHRLQLFRRADLAHSLVMEITSPNRGHLFPNVPEAVFPVKVTALYGQPLNGALAFKGAPYVWKKPELTAEVPLVLTPQEPSRNLLLPIKPPKPGHYTGLVSVTDGKTPLYSQRMGFVFQPEGIPPAEPPADFDAFWDSTLAELEKIPLDMTLEPQTELETAAGTVYKVKYRSWGGRWAWAWLNVPKAEGKMPGRVMCPPVSVWQPGKAQPGGGELVIWVAVHGGDLKDFPAKPDFDYMNSGITSRETYMLRYSYCCLARCFDIIRNQPKCNGTVAVQGGSQGAGLSLVLAGMRPAEIVRGQAVALCRIDWTILGFAQWGPSCPKDADPKQVAEVVRYFDPACFAHRIRSPLRLAFGLFDFCAPAEGIFTALNAVPKDVKVEIAVDPYGGHFTLDTPGFWEGKDLIEVPRWQGTAADNKLVR